jgi:hypothetical protein
LSVVKLELIGTKASSPTNSTFLCKVNSFTDMGPVKAIISSGRVRISRVPFK